MDGCFFLQFVHIQQTMDASQWTYKAYCRAGSALYWLSKGSLCLDIVFTQSKLLGVTPNKMYAYTLYKNGGSKIPNMEQK